MAAAPRSHVHGLLVLGVVFHAIYVLSIFDIYFTSPVVPHVESLAYASSASPPAKRLVVFVADGCRADLFFERNASRVSFLRHVIEARGSFGVSHTRVPTESRPGHVALFAGMYEDVSAVTKGWQDNPVDFDSVFNQSQHAWLFGSPDIVPMFARRVPHAEERHYSHEHEDFASSDASQLDVWVHDRVKELLLVDARANATLEAQLRADGVVFFLHFLGIDTNGHAHRPQSNDYLHNIAVVDELVEKTVRLLDDFYDDDGQTAFVFTADHGMSNKGAHGDGDPTNTRTPLVVWGAGIAGPEKAEPSSPDFRIDLPTQSRDQIAAQLRVQREQEALAAQQWGLTHLVRRDVMQADVAPLLSALLGLPYPRNSVGVLPFSFLSQGDYRTRAVVSNARQLQLHAQRKAHEKEAHTLLWFRAYAPFQSLLPKLVDEMETSWARGALPDAERIAQHAIDVCLATLEYFQRYDWLFLFTTIVLGYLGWIGVLAVAYLAPLTPRATDFHALRAVTTSCVANGVAFPLVAFSIATFLALEHSPWSYFVYVSFPLVFWNAVWTHRAVLVSRPSSPSASSAARPWLLAAWVLASLELVVLGYNHRWIFGVVFALLALWPALETAPSTALSTRWSLACLVLAGFPFLPTEYGEQTALVVLGGLAVAALALAVDRRASVAMTALPLVASLVAVHVTMDYLTSKIKPPAALTIANWVLSFAPVVVAVARKQLLQSPREQLIRIALSLAPSFVLLSISYEVLFFAALLALLLAWIDMEAAIAESSVWQDVRRAFFFLVLVKIAFFGTGNVASMSSFEISSTYRFVTVFAPFLMGALLVGKILIPFLLVACAFRLILQSRTSADPKQETTSTAARSFLLVVAMSDVLALHFLFLVENEGSWKQIGNSISMFGIVNAQIVFVPLLFLLAGGFLTSSAKAEHRKSA